MINNNFGHSDVLDYFPLKDGIKPSQMGLRRLNYDDPRKNKIFQIDDYYDKFIENKQECMEENSLKYSRRALGLDLSNVENFIYNTLNTEYPGRFDNVCKNTDGTIKNFEKLARYIPEDIVIILLRKIGVRYCPGYMN